MDRDAIVAYADEKGTGRTRPRLRELLTEDQISQIKYARSQGVPWAVIADYFREKYGIDYHKRTYLEVFRNLSNE